MCEKELQTKNLKDKINENFNLTAKDKTLVDKIL